MDDGLPISSLMGLCIVVLNVFSYQYLAPKGAFMQFGCQYPYIMLSDDGNKPLENAVLALWGLNIGSRKFQQTISSPL